MTPRLFVRLMAALCLAGGLVVPLDAVSAQGTPRVITGKVTSSDGARPLQGVTVLLRGTRYGTLTIC